ncbi:MAG: hypothetical protein GY708_25615, partial [Actinomycetia bacterium]|nr:hypothetical protein [Actinomycetes bacterium]
MAVLATAAMVGSGVPVGALASDWVQRGDDIDGPTAQDWSGWSVAMSGDGDTVIIGATQNNIAFGAGQARVFDWSGGAWVQRGSDIDGETASDGSGWSVAMSGDGNTVIIGAPLNDGGGDSAGQARVFDWSGVAWVQRGDDIDGEATNDESGWSVAMSGDGDTVIIGAPGMFAAEGQARVLDWSGVAWVQRGSDIDGETAGDRSGESVAMSGDGDTVIIGAPRNGGSAGQARVLDWSGVAWVQRGSDI